MNKFLLSTVMTLMLSGVVAPLSPACAADQTIDDLVRRTSDSGASLPAPSFVPPRMVPGSSQLSRVEHLRAPAAEKIKPPGDDQPPLVVKEIISSSIEPSTPSPLERQITSDDILGATKVSDINPARTLTQFGYNYFKNVTFYPQTDVPVSDDYLTGPGDTLVLNVWGSVEGTYELPVSRSGEVFLPKGGPVRVAGVPFGRLAEVFRLRLAKEYRDFDLSVNMGKLRTVKVNVVGEVAAPGNYSLSSLSTLLNALSAAGGPTKNGSLRSIKLRHAGQAEETIDLYDFFTRGDKNRDIRLHSGDTIFVPVIGRVAAIAGDVKRPAIYELKDETSLKDLLGLAEGITATGYLQRVQISRVVANDKKKVLDLNLDTLATGKPLDQLAAAITIQDLDVVRIFPINSLLRDHFRIEGHVDRPGSFALKPGMRLGDVLSREHLLPEYFPDFLEITRLMPPDLMPQKIVVNLEAALTRDPAQNLEIREFDIIRVFSRLELERQPRVKVAGEVQKPGEYRLYKEMTIRDLLIQAGYPTPSAYLASADLSRLKKNNDTVSTFPLSVNLAEALKGNPQANILLEPFDELTIKKLPDWAEETGRYISLSGEIRFPGVYPIYKSERLCSVIERAGGLTDKAYLRGMKFTRESLRQLQQKQMDESLARAEEEIVRKQAQLAEVASSKEELEAARSDLEGLKRTIGLLRNKRAEGRLLIQVPSLEDLRRECAGLELRGGDNLFVPSDPKAINILGQVYNPASVIFAPNEDVDYYLGKVGGPTDNAEEDEIYLVKMDGTVFSKKQSAGFLFFNRFMAHNVDSGDSIIVPQRYAKTAWMRDIKDIATILGQIALTAGVLIAAGL
ncbi:MAG: SLBB domain-containing protein [Geobacteraceae bacterium]|nr:SLBB domain-containing protein [Geobacteraceae bacterium]